MAGTRIQLCSRLVVELDGRRLENELPGRQGRLLLAYLVANRARPATRGELIGAVWPEAPPSNTDAALSSLLSKLRRALGSDRIEGRGDVRLRLPDGAWVDLEAAGEALHRAEAAVARGDFPAAWGPGRVTQHIASREFMPGEEAAWIVDIRARLETMRLRSLELVAEACLAMGGSELDTAERTARSLVKQAPYRESGYRFLMQVLAARGLSAEALRVYDQLRVLLRDELGTAPSAATKALHRELLG